MVFTDLSQLFDAGKHANREPAVERAVDSSVQPSGGSFRRTKSGRRIERGARGPGLGAPRLPRRRTARPRERSERAGPDSAGA
jgi:hypothetical protein